MALDKDLVWEIRTTGDDDNGGAFKTGASGTDYSQQDAAQLTLTDLATSGIGVTTLTSATGGFTAAMIGNTINIKSGTNVTAGFYEITAHTDTNTVTLDRAPDDGVGGISSGTGSVGGALASPGKFSGGFVKGNIGHIKKGTYTLTTSSVDVAGGPAHFPGTNKVIFKGYNATRGDLDLVIDDTNKPIISAGAVTGITVIKLPNSDYRNQQYVMNIVVDANNGASNKGFEILTKNFAIGCKAINAPVQGFLSDGTTISCWAKDCDVGFGITAARAYRCVAEDCTTKGFHVTGDDVKDCIAINCGDGFFINSGDSVTHERLTAVNCTGDGFDIQVRAVRLVDCVATDNGGWGFKYPATDDARESCALINCFHFNNTSGGKSETLFQEINFTALTADPWDDKASDDYQINNTSGGGAVLRAAGVGVPTQTNNMDVSLMQHADPAVNLLTHPGMGGGLRG